MRLMKKQSLAPRAHYRAWADDRVTGASCKQWKVSGSHAHLLSKTRRGSTGGPHVRSRLSEHSWSPKSEFLHIIRPQGTFGRMMSSSGNFILGDLTPLKLPGAPSLGIILVERESVHVIGQWEDAELVLYLETRKSCRLERSIQSSMGSEDHQSGIGSLIDEPFWTHVDL